MEAGTGPYLVIRRDDGYGDVIALAVGQRCTLGRANTNRVVLKDELCSREHAEVYFAEGRWYLRDLKSLNDTRIKGVPASVGLGLRTASGAKRRRDGIWPSCA